MNVVELPARRADVMRASSAAMSGNALVLDGVTRQFGALRAIDHITFEVPAGERRAILGANGAGKTTLFNAITGDFPPTGRHGSFLRRRRDQPAAARADSPRVAAHVSILIAVSRAVGARQPFSCGSRRNARAFQYASPTALGPERDRGGSTVAPSASRCRRRYEGRCAIARSAAAARSRNGIGRRAATDSVR